MNAELRKSVRRNVLSFGLVMTTFATVVGMAVVEMRSNRRETGELEQEIQRLRAQLLAPAAGGELGAIEQERRLQDWSDVCLDEARRIASISARAREANVTIATLSTEEVGRAASAAPEASVLSTTHVIECTGRYEDIAGFLDGVAEVDGLAAVEQLRLQPDLDLDAGLLSATVTVTWFGPDLTSADAAGEGTE